MFRNCDITFWRCVSLFFIEVHDVPEVVFVIPTVYNWMQDTCVEYIAFGGMMGNLYGMVMQKKSRERERTTWNYVFCLCICFYC